MTVPDKPGATRLGWVVERSSYPLETPWMRVRQDRIVTPQGTVIPYTYVRKAPAVGIVPVAADGTIFLIRQYRYPPDDWCLEIPAGGTFDRSAQPLADAARDELREEIGGMCDELLPISAYYVAAGLTNQRFHVFLALDVTRPHAPEREASEQIELVPLPAREAIHMARAGEITDGLSALALLHCEPVLRERGYLKGEGS